MKLTAGLSSGKVAIDGTGFSKTNSSFHYLKRIDKINPKNYTKPSALLNIEIKKFLMMRIRTTPRHDMQDVKYLLKRIEGMKIFYGDGVTMLNGFMKCVLGLMFRLLFQLENM